MAKATPLTGDIMNMDQAPITALNPRTVIKESPKKTIKEPEKQVPLQILWGGKYYEFVHE